MLHRIVDALTRPDLTREYVRSRLIQQFGWNEYYRALRDPKTTGHVVVDDVVGDTVAADLSAAGVLVRDLAVDVVAFRRYVERADYSSRWPYYDGGRARNFVEKALEHFLATTLLDLSPQDSFIDIANDRSPVPEIYHELTGCSSYRQDLAFLPGLHGNRIGGNAEDLPLSDGFASKLSLHCSFEHFEGNSDIGFIREASRILRPGGRLCVVPLYLFETYAIQTNPALMPRGGIPFDADALLYCAPTWRNRHNRFYDVPHFVERILGNLGDLRLTVYYVRNAREVDLSCYVRFIALFEKPEVAID